jgi:hypothetical protein
MQILCVSPRAAFSAAAVVGILVGVGQIAGVAQRGNAASPVIGVWRVVEITTTGPNAKKNTSPQPSVVIYTARYYSVNVVTADAPRPVVSEPTDKQIAEFYHNFLGNAGTYEINGNELTYRRIVAKSPSAMKAGNFSTYTFRIEGKDTLWVTAKSDEDGPVQNPETVKLTRIE